jgi:hypothetical protein
VDHVQQRRVSAIPEKVLIEVPLDDTPHLASVNKSLNKPADYARVLQALARRHVYAITSFIFGLDNDTPGVAERTLSEIRAWPPGLPVFGQITPFPATPLYERLKKEGRLTRPNHWLEFAPFQMAHTPLKITISAVQNEVRYAWVNSYSPAAIERAIESIADEPAAYKISHLMSRLFFRGIYFPQKGAWDWLKLAVQNRRASVAWSGTHSPAGTATRTRRVVSTSTAPRNLLSATLRSRVPERTEFFPGCAPGTHPSATGARHR